MLSRIKPYFSSVTQDGVSYAATTFGSHLMHSIFMFFYVKIFVNHYQVSNWWFQFSQVIFMIWNTINDPLFGYFQDNSNWKFFKSRRLSILVGAPFFAITFLMPWFPWGTYTKDYWLCGLHLMVALCAYDAVFTFVLLAQCCLFAEMSISYKDRLNMKWCGVLAGLLSSWAVPLANYVSTNLEDMFSFRVYCIVVAVIGFFAMRYTGQHAYTSYEKEVNMGLRNPGLDSDTSPKSRQGSVKTLTWQILNDRDFEGFVWTNFFQIFHSVYLSNFTAIFLDYLTDISPAQKSLFYMLLFTLPGFAILFGRNFILKVGYYRCIQWSCFLKIFMAIAVYVVGCRTVVFLPFILIDTIFVHATFSLYDLVLSDIADKDMEQHKRSHPISSMIFGTNALITKPSVSLAPMLIVAILKSYGYESGHAPHPQTTTTGGGTTAAVAIMTTATAKSPILKAVMFNIACIIPLAIGLLQLFTWSFYRIRSTHNKKHNLDSEGQLISIG